MAKKNKISPDMQAFMRELIKESLRDWFKKKKAGSKGKTVVKNTKKATVQKEGLCANINAKKKAG